MLRFRTKAYYQKLSINAQTAIRGDAQRQHLHGIPWCHGFQRKECAPKENPLETQS